MLSRTDRNTLIARYTDGPRLLRAAWESVPDEARHWRPADKKWSAHEVVCHCADSETYAAIRIRMLFCERDAMITAYNENVWCEKLDYHALSADLALDTIEAVRAYTVPVLRAAKEDYWHHVGLHTEHGRYSAEDWLRIYAEHLEVHARQIERNVKAWQESAKVTGER